MRGTIIQGRKGEFTSPDKATAIAEEAYLYGLQQVIFYETRYTCTQDRSSNVFAGVNRYHVVNDGKPITPAFTAIVTPNATTPYAMAFPDLAGRTGGGGDARHHRKHCNVRRKPQYTENNR